MADRDYVLFKGDFHVSWPKNPPTGPYLPFSRYMLQQRRSEMEADLAELIRRVYQETRTLPFLTSYAWTRRSRTRWVAEEVGWWGVRRWRQVCEAPWRMRRWWWRRQYGR